MADQSVSIMLAIVLSNQMSGSITLQCPVMACSPGWPAKVLLCSEAIAC
jgi:hypothetical protein